MEGGKRGEKGGKLKGEGCVEWREMVIHECVEWMEVFSKREDWAGRRWHWR